MENILYTLLNVTLLSSAAILAVIVIKALFKNNIGAKAISILWALVLLRMLLPVSIESPIKLNQLIPASAPVIEEPQTQNAHDNFLEGNINEDNFDIFAEDNLEERTAQSPAADMENNNMPEIDFGETASFSQRMKTLYNALDIKIALVTIWLTIGAVFIAACIYNIVRFNFKLTSSVIVSKKLFETFSRAKKILAFGENVKIAESKEADMPITYGLLKPVIVIPEALVATISDRKLTLIIMHELMHIRRGDIFKNYLWLLAKAVHWFNPLVWIAYKMYLRDMEIVCDKMVIKNTAADERVEYSQSLLESARFMKRADRPMSPAMLSFSEDRSKLRRRIMNILHPVKQSRKQIFALGLLIIILVAGCFTTACQAADDSKAVDDAMMTTAAPATAPIDENSSENEAAEYTAIPSPAQPKLEEDIAPWTQTREIGNCEVTVSLDLLHYETPRDSNVATVISVPDIFDIDFAQKVVNILMDEAIFANIQTISDANKRIETIGSYADNRELSPLERLKVEDKLFKLEYQIGDAPENNADGEVIFERDGEVQQLSLKSYDENGDKKTIHIVNDLSYGPILHFARDMVDKKFVEFDFPEYIGPEDTYTMNEYYQQAQELVNELSGGIMRGYITYGAIFPDWVTEDDSLALEDGEECYVFYFFPKIDGASVIYGMHAIGDSDARNMVPDFDHKLYNEYVKVIVDKNGIRDLFWINKEEIIEKESNSHVPITLEQAIDIFKENIFDVTSWEQRGSVSTEITIIAVRYGLVNIEQDDGTYKLIPVYAFEGTQSVITTDGSSSIKYPASAHASFMLVSAIDGSVIDFYN
ncbi:MAG: M56 family metallopeptidase [Clostridia bacterium]|nr:M56 family metallopeptidase [Clostridia bacterium]